MNKNKLKNIIFLHSIMPVYSLSGICSKFASKCKFLSFEWIILYGLVIFFLGVYAILWQQVLKRVPLNFAYANKSVTLAWGMLFGALIFNETLSPQNIIGAAIVLIGVIIMVTGKSDAPQEALD